MAYAFSKIGIMGRRRTPGAMETIVALARYLESRHIHVVLDEQIAGDIGAHHYQVSTTDQFGKYCDLIIVVGGDGSLLNAAHAVVDQQLPVLGINRGGLGFLTDINPSELEQQIGEILDGQFDEEERFLLHADIERDGVIETQQDALNEVVLYAGDVARMIEFEVYVNHQFVYSQRSDGLIIATPTGSTAYALSGGGPIVHPELDAIIMVPMFPHTLTSRPIVLSSNVQIDIVVAPAIVLYPGVSCDGQAPVLLAPGDHIKIYKKATPLRLLHPLSHDYYDVLRTKLQWGTQLKRPRE